MSIERKRFAYAFVGMRPSECLEVGRLLAQACQDFAELRVAEASEHADFWVVNGNDVDSVRRVHAEGAVHVLAVGGEGDDMLRVERPFDLRQAQLVLARLMRELPDNPWRDAPATVVESAYVKVARWAERDSSGFSEYASDLELTPSELAMTEDEPSDLRMARRAAAHQRRMGHAGAAAGGPESIRTLEPTGVFEPASQEWLDVLPAQLLGVADAGNRTRTLPKGLRRMGFGVDVMEGLPDALQAIARSEYRMVFLDQGGVGPDLVKWCKAFLQARNSQAQPLGVVVIARRKALWDRWRAMRAGCVAWMTVPLDRTELLGFLLQHGVERSLPREF
jgi:CheY-like chemotaxis protein